MQFIECYKHLVRRVEENTAIPEKLKNKQKAIILTYGKREKQGRDMSSVAKSYLLKKRTFTTKNE